MFVIIHKWPDFTETVMSSVYKHEATACYYAKEYRIAVDVKGVTEEERGHDYYVKRLHLNAEQLA